MFKKGDILKSVDGILFVHDGVEDTNFPQGFIVDEDYNLLGGTYKTSVRNVKKVGFSKHLSQMSQSEMNNKCRFGGHNGNYYLKEG